MGDRNPVSEVSAQEKKPDRWDKINSIVAGVIILALAAWYLNDTHPEWLMWVH